MKKDKLLIRKFFKFYMSLPIFEYECSADDTTHLFNRPTSLGAYGNRICNFRYKRVELNEEKCRDTLDDISRALSIDAVSSLNVGLKDYQSMKYLKVDTALENSYQLVIDPLHLLLEEISGEIFEHVSDNLNYVDGPFKGTSQTLCYEFKQFPIMHENYLQDGSFDIDKLFKDETYIGFNGNPLLKYLKQLELAMMSHKIDRGILSDLNTFIFVVIDLERFEREIKGKLKEGAEIELRYFPIKYKVVSYHSGKLTAREYLLDFNYHSLRTEKELKEIRKKMEAFEKYYQLSTDKDDKIRKRAAI